MSLSQFDFVPQEELRLSADVQTRIDNHTAELVEQGLFLQKSIGTACALEYFQAHRIPPHVTCRVLMGTLHRRA